MRYTYQASRVTVAAPRRGAGGESRRLAGGGGAPAAQLRRRAPPVADLVLLRRYSMRTRLITGSLIAVAIVVLAMSFQAHFYTAAFAERRAIAEMQRHCSGFHLDSRLL